MKKYLHYLFITCILFLAFTRTVIAQTDTNYPRIINLNLTNQQAELKIMGYSGYSYLVKASTNLYDWTDIGTVGFITAGQQSLGYLYFDDIDAYSYKYRYYTVVIGTNEPIMLRIDSPTNGVYMFGTPIEVAASYDDPANVATNIAYVINGTIVYESENMTSWFTWTPTNSGMHTCFAEIRDSNGGAYRSSIIPFMIDTNHPPAFYSPLEVTSDGLGGVNIQALLEDYEGSPDHVEYYIDNQLVGMADVNMNYIFNWRGGSVGNHKVYGKGFDIYGASCWSSTNQFTLTTVSNPTIKIINPTYGSFKLQQALEITAEVNAGLNIDHVEFFIGSNSLATVSSEPYTTAWKPNEPGYFSLTAAAYDVAGTMALSAPIIVHIDTNQAPKVSIDLTNGLVVPFNSDLTFRVIVTDREGRVGDVNLFDGVNMIGSTSGQETNEFQWNAHEPGVHLFYSTAFDEQGLSAQSLIYSVTVLSNLPPVVEVTSPLHNTIINDNIIRLEATASSDNTFIDRVVFYHDDIFIGTTSSEPYYFDWSPDSPLPAGGYQIYAMAYDSIGDVTRSKVVQLLIQASLPTLTITPASGSSYGTTSSIPIAVSATGQFGVITNVTIFTNDVLLANIKTAPWTYNWSQPRTGTYRITGLGHKGFQAKWCYPAQLGVQHALS